MDLLKKLEICSTDATLLCFRMFQVSKIPRYFANPRYLRQLFHCFPCFIDEDWWFDHQTWGCKRNGGCLAKKTWDTNPMIAAGDKLHDSRQRNLNFTAVHLGFLKSESLKVTDFLMIFWLVVSTPLKNVSQLWWLFPIYGKIKAMFQTTNQFSILFHDFEPWVTIFRRAYTIHTFPAFSSTWSKALCRQRILKAGTGGESTVSLGDSTVAGWDTINVHREMWGLSLRLQFDWTLLKLLGLCVPGWFAWMRSRSCFSLHPKER